MRPQTGPIISKVVIFHLEVQRDKGRLDKAGVEAPTREGCYPSGPSSHYVETSERAQSSLSCKPNYYHMASTVLQLQSFQEAASRRFSRETLVWTRFINDFH